MDSNDCQLIVKIIFGNKNFKLESSNIITLEQIKNLSLEKFGLKKEEKEFLSFSYQNQNSESFFIESENDLIKYADEKDSALEINIYLNLDTKNEILITDKNENYNSEKTQSNLNKEYEKQINELKEEIEKQKNQKNNIINEYKKKIKDMNELEQKFNSEINKL